MNRTWLQRLVLWGSPTVLFLLAVRLYSFGYFYVDDMNNFSLAQRESGWSMLWHVLNPLANYYRPTGMLVYWVAFQSFDFNPLPYNLLAWLLHAASTVLIFLVLQKFVCSSYAAAAGTVFFVFQATYADVYYNFGTIFELLAGFFFLLALLTYLRWERGKTGLLLFSLFYYLAVTSKEMAITLPAVVILYESLVRGARRDPGCLLRRLWPAGLIGAFFLGLKLFTMRGSTSEAPYYLDFSLGAAINGLIWYLNALGRTSHSGLLWLGVAGVLLALCLALRERRALFFLAVIPVAFLPVLFLVNHRVPFFWYIPFLGVAGLAAVLVERAQGALDRRFSFRYGWLAGLVLFALASAQHYSYHSCLSRTDREWVRGLTAEYRNFLSGLGRIEGIEDGQTIYFTSPPRHFDENSISSAARVVLRRPNLRAQIVDKLPPGAVYHVDFSRQQVEFQSKHE